MRYYTPLRYPGGKRKLAPFIKQVFVDNNLCDGIYVEPYAGGSAIALELVMTGYAREAWLNDIDPAIHAFWYSALYHSEDLIKRILTTPLTINEWHCQRDIYSNPDKYDVLSLGFATLYLNRTNRSGILDAGVIGGLDQKGKWLIDARFNREDLVKRLRRIEQHKHHIHLFNMDAEVLLKDINLPKRSLIYLDPPYFRKAQRLYRNHYAKSDHARIAKLVQKNLKNHWIVSYDDVPEIAELYKNAPKIRYVLNYSAQTKRNGGELMFFSKSLNYPNTNNPALYRGEA